MLAAAGDARGAAEGSTAPRVSANLVFWDQARGTDAILANLDVLTEVSPFWYRVLPDGRVEPYRTAAGSTYEDWALVSYLQSRGILVIPTVANALDGVWDGAAVGRIIADPQLRATNIDALVDLAVSNGYDGIDLDYENLKASDRDVFSAFVRELAAALHARGKLLAVDVYGKTSEPGTWDGPMAQDWRAIGESADYVRIMAYEYHWAASNPGPVAPIWWVNDVLAFAGWVVPLHKITLGVPLYGYDWVGTTGTPLVWEDAAGLAARHGASIEWDATAAASWFEYSVKGRVHTVWFENGESVGAKLALARSYGIGGVFFWRLGGEDPAVWAKLGPGSDGEGDAGRDVTPPSVTLTMPVDGSVVSRKQQIAASAADDTALAGVEFYIDGELVASDTAAPYVTWWNTRRAASGLHTIRAVAYDAAGNTGIAQVTVRVP